MIIHRLISNKRFTFLFLLLQLCLFIKILKFDWNSNNLINKTLISIKKNDLNNQLKYNQLIKQKEDLKINCIEYFNNLPQEIYDNQQLTLKLLRIYSKCFLQNEYNLNNCSNFESLISPFFTGKLPIYTHWDNQSYVLPQSTSFCNWNHFINQFINKGIVISISDNQDNIEESLSLLKILRFWSNTLPIQFVHKGDLSITNQNKLISMARDNLSLNLSNGTLLNLSSSPQDLWFVDASPSISKKFLKKFTHFKNKWISMLFNLFQEIILMDTDVVPFINPSKFFDLEDYLKYNAHFFKDRLLPQFIDNYQLIHYKSLLPSGFEKKFFNISVDQSFIAENGFFNFGTKHLMESGLVIMNRTKPHFAGLLASVNLQLNDVTSKAVYGDKELFWIGQILIGNHNSFSFNDNNAAAIGTYNATSKLICSTQMGHFDSNLKLLWTNGGLNICKKNYAFFWDYTWYKSLRKKFSSIAKMKKSYSNPVDLKFALIPPKNDIIPTIIKNIKISMVDNFKKDRSLGCDGYFYCAFRGDDPSDQGTLIKFNNDELNLYNHVIDIWNSKLVNSSII